MTYPRIMTRQSTARQNIDTAIHLLLDLDALASANLLAWAAIDILQGVAKSKGVSTLSARIEERLFSDKIQEWYRHLKEHYNYAKHADKDPDKELEFKIEIVEMALFQAATDYQSIYKTISIPMALIQHWVLLSKPGILLEEAKIYFTSSKALFEGASDIKTLKEIYSTYLENRPLLVRMAELNGIDKFEL